MTDFKANIEHLLLGYYIKYNRLKELNDMAFSNSTSDVVDVYVDLFDMLKPLYNTNVYADKQYTIVSSIINLAAHIREYYWSRHRVNSRIFLVYGDETSMNHRQFYFGFGVNETNNTLNYDKISSIINSQLEMVKILCAYIYGVYYVHKSTDFSMFVYDNVNKNLNIPTVLLTKSVYAYQIPALCKNVVLFRPKKYNGEDISFAVNYSTVLRYYFNKLNKHETLEKLSYLDSEILSLLITVTGMPYKKLLTLFNSTTAINKVYDAVINNKIINGYNSDIDYVYNVLDIQNKVDAVNFKYRFNAVDLVFQHRIYNNSPEARDISWNIDLNDKHTIQDINNRYFIDNPLDLNSL